ncbi:hypothetical protein V8C42DRAFT_328937 [Trichoderma barbatum]
MQGARRHLCTALFGLVLVVSIRRDHSSDRPIFSSQCPLSTLPLPTCPCNSLSDTVLTQTMSGPRVQLAIMMVFGP